jgi:CDP-paratose 2-epimerase
MDTTVKKILVTGSTGLVGSEAVKFFTEKGWEVIGVDANMRAAFFDTPDKTPTTPLDIRDEKAVSLLFQEHTFDAIIHAAAQPSHDYSKEHVLEDFDVNAGGTVVLLEAARKYCPKAVFVHVSTDKVYGWGMRRFALAETEYLWEDEMAFHEDTPFEPPYSPFGVSKLCADLYAQEYAAQGWLTTGIFRPGCITGRAHEGAEMHGFLAYLVKCIKEGKTYKIFGYKGKQVRDQIHAHDLVNAFYHFVENPKSGQVYNIGGGFDRALSPLLAGRMVSEKLSKPFLYEYIEDPRFGDRQWDVHDMSKFQRDYPTWDYEYSLDDVLNDVCS